MKLQLTLLALAAGAALAHVSAQDITSPADPIIGGMLNGSTFTPATAGTIAGANNYPAAESPNFAIDNSNTTKYLNFAKLNTGFVVTPLVGATRVTGIHVSTANDAPERDPVTYQLEGTNGDPLNGLYALIASGSTGLDTDPGRLTFAPQQNFANSAAYTSYRLIFPTVRNAANANSMQVGEVELIGQAIPEPSTMGLLGLTTLGVAAYRRRR